MEITVFLVHSLADREKARAFRDSLQRGAETDGTVQDGRSHSQDSIQVLINDEIRADWKREVRGNIHRAGIVLYLQGKNPPGRNIQWEIELALEEKKPVLVCQEERCPLPDWLYRTELSTPFGNFRLNETFQASILYKGILQKLAPLSPLLSVNREDMAWVCDWESVEKIRTRIVQLAARKYSIFSDGFALESVEDTAVSSLLLEQYKLYQQTAEELENREQKVNEFYLAINTALLTFMGVIIGIANTSQGSKFSVLLVIALAGGVFNRSWCREIESLKIISRAKMRMINLIEQHLPLRLYDKEYVIMKDDPDRTYKNKVEDKEAVPRSFNFIYGAILVVYTAGVLFHTLLSLF